MKSSSTKCWNRLLIGVACLVLFVMGAAGQERVVEQHNCAFTPPAGWTEPSPLPPQPGLAGLYRKPDGQSVLLLLIDDKNKVGPMDDHVAAEIERGIADSGAGTRIWGKMSEMGGSKAYERLGELDVSGRKTSFYIRMAPVAGKTYSLQAMRFDGNAAEDPDVQRAFASFRFLMPPPRPPFSVSPATRAGDLAGHFIFVFVLLLLVLGVPAAIFFILRRGKRKASIPPPIPPQG